MTTRCLHCQKIMLQPEPHEDCPNKDACNFETISLIHFVSPEGAYKQVGVGQRIGTGKEGHDIVTKESMKLHCKTIVPNTLYSSAKHAVTCLFCIATFHPDIEVEE